MNIAYITNGHDVRLGSETHRARWPALWVNRYTDHSAAWYSGVEIRETGCMDVLRRYNVVVLHKQEHTNRRVAEWLARNHPSCVIVFDTDDLEAELWPEYALNAWLADIVTDPRDVMPEADGYTVASAPLAEIYGRLGPTQLVENAFDVNHAAYHPTQQTYYNDRVKIAWGGGGSHVRDIAMVRGLGLFDHVTANYDADIWIYGLYPESRRKRLGRGEIILRPGLMHDKYLPEYFSDATFLFAPLVNDRFNACRSTLKLVEAGFARKAIIATAMHSYRSYRGIAGVVLVENERDAWCRAADDLINNPDRRREYAEANHDAAMTYHTAEVVTKQRINFYMQLREMKCTR